MGNIYVTRIWIEGHHLYAATDKGLEAKYDLSKFKGFRNATQNQLNDFTVLGGHDIHWNELDEDINLEGMFYDNNLCQLTDTEDSVVYRPVPESNDCVAEPIPRRP